MKQVKAFIRFESLSAENINKAIKSADTFLAKQGIDSWERTRHRLLMQKILLKYSDIKTETPFCIYTRRYYKRIAIMIAVKCKRFDPMKDADAIFDEELLSGMANPPRWNYRIGWNRLLYSTQTLMPGKEAVKRLIQYMGKERSSFRTAGILRFVNMVLLVIEPLLAARIITSINGSDLQKILMFVFLVALLDACCCLVTYISSRKILWCRKYC